MKSPKHPTRHLRQPRARWILQALSILAILPICLWNTPGQIRHLETRPLVTGAGGELDPGFGSGGMVSTDILGSSDEGMAVVIQNDGKIVAAGGAYTGTTWDFALTRYLPNGTLDSSFGIGGKVTTHFPGGNSFINTIALQPNGRILVAGQARTAATNFDFALARYTKSGALDQSFGVGGLVTTDFLTGNDNAWSLALQPDGRIVAAGIARNQVANDDFAMSRYNSDGSLDSTFGADHTGKVVTDLGGANNFLHAIALLPTGQIMAGGGVVDPVSNTDFVLARYTAAGVLDLSFGNQGIVQTDFFGSVDVAWYLGVQSDGKAVLAGCALRMINDDPKNLRAMAGLARYNADGSLDPSFGGVGGQVVVEFVGMDVWPYAGAILSNGSIIIGGAVVPDGEKASFGLACFTKDGMLDDAFGGFGGVETDFFGDDDFVNGIAIQPDGKIVAIGDTVHPGSGLDFALARYLMADDFSLSLDTPTVTAGRGTAVRVWININRTSSSIGSVTVTPPDTFGIGVKMKPPEPLATTGSSVSFKLKIKAGATIGPHQLTFTASDGQGRTRSAIVTLIIE